MRLTERTATAAACALVGTAVLAVTACGGGTNVSTPPEELLVQAVANAREQRTLVFELEYLRVRADRPDDPERYGWGDGALDLSDGRGRLRLELDLGLAQDMASPLDEPVELRWDPDSVEAELDGRVSRVAREQARERWGLVGRVPDEPAAMLTLLEHARAPRLLGDEVVNGERLTVVEATVDARRAGETGAPAELRGAATSGALGDELALTAWIDERGLARRVVLTVRLEPVSSGRNPVLPGRQVRVSYDLAAYGEPVSGLQFASQAG